MQLKVNRSAHSQLLRYMAIYPTGIMEKIKPNYQRYRNGAACCLQLKCMPDIDNHTTCIWVDITYLRLLPVFNLGDISSQ